MRLVLTKSRGEEGHMSYVLDSLDRQIIRILQQDGRTSNVETARQAGVSEDRPTSAMGGMVGGMQSVGNAV